MNPFHLNPESFLTIPGKIWIYWKNKKGIYLGCNELMAKSLYLASPKDIVGLSDHELPLIQPAEAAVYTKCDQQVFRRGITLQFQDTATLPESKIEFLVIKTPLFSKQRKKILGIVGLSYYQSDIKTVIEQILTPRESEIISHLIRGKTAKEIAAAINLSHRTVEHYLEDIRFKTQTSSRSELIEMFIDLF